MPGGTFRGHLLPANVEGLRSPSQAGRRLQLSTGLCVESLVSCGFWYFFHVSIQFKKQWTKQIGLKYLSWNQHCKEQYRQIFSNKEKAVTQRVWLMPGKDPLCRFQSGTRWVPQTHTSSHNGEHSDLFTFLRCLHGWSQTSLSSWGQSPYPGSIFKLAGAGLASAGPQLLNSSSNKCIYWSLFLSMILKDHSGKKLLNSSHWRNSFF